MSARECDALLCIVPKFIHSNEKPGFAAIFEFFVAGIGDRVRQTALSPLGLPWTISSAPEHGVERGRRVVRAAKHNGSRWGSVTAQSGPCAVAGGMGVSQTTEVSRCKLLLRHGLNLRHSQPLAWNLRAVQLHGLRSRAELLQ